MIMGVSYNDLIQLVRNKPGLTTAEIASELEAPIQSVWQKLNALCEAQIPVIKKTGLKPNRFYPFDYRIPTAPGPVDKPGTVLAVDGKPLRLFKMTAAELKMIAEQARLKNNKYSEIAEILNTLEVGEGTYIQEREGLSARKLRDGVKSAFVETEKKFTIKDEVGYIVVVRIS